MLLISFILLFKISFTEKRLKISSISRNFNDKREEQEQNLKNQYPLTLPLL